MFKINRKLEYALISLKAMSAKSPGQLTSAKEICDIYRTPFDPTSRVLQIMAQHEIVRAEQGAHGGYQIMKDLGKITLYDLTQIIEGPIQIVNCFHGNYSHCDMTSQCNVISPMLNLNERIAEMFKTINVYQLISSRNQGEKMIRSKPFMQEA
ncbi:MAG: Rrf2 family transcriptional regulator [Candidatus Omnitrophica bacterium]|nr:Rrf2 family transcriptional regulator [Candidatus Omnitrophota bacterium]MDE2009355.1 Rrf2 family transcriptional regulator [Candidatus Omnitrophota bacterium]MDE2214139.1 Rrf2 family transcriptional regulator [Candidatus Omnitrophota bacterium]MDE2231176.1 Rrf2 family transcriptional regulator [Candidatus Omnitrophota bacterium]